MNTYKRDKYEDIYRQAWLAQNIKDKADNPRWNGGISNSALNGFTKHTSVNKGGRPKLPLSKVASVLNNLLHREISLNDAADIMGTTVKSLRQIKSRYNLPRSEDGPETNEYQEVD
jgi:hypothetical protein